MANITQNKSKVAQAMVKLSVKSKQATPAPPIGPALGQKGVNIQDFCKRFNAMTESMEAGLPLPVKVFVYGDKTFKIEIKQPNASFLIRRAIGLDKGSAVPNKNKVGKLTNAQLQDIAKVKWPDLTAGSVDAAVRTLSGTARSMGVEVVD